MTRNDASSLPEAFLGGHLRVKWARHPRHRLRCIDIHGGEPYISKLDRCSIQEHSIPSTLFVGIVHEATYISVG